MVALRKDVKVGLTIGAIAVSVIGVYAGLSALAGEKPADANTAKLDVSSGGQVDHAPSNPTIVADRTSGASTGSTIPKPAPINTALTALNAPNSGSFTVASATGSTPTQANPTDAVSASTPAGDPWAVAFGSGSIQPKKTVTPSPGTKVDPAADRASTIQSLNGDTKADPTRSTASATDGSGSLNAGGSSELTHSTVPAGPEKSHTVAPGETLSAISSQYYGDSKYFSVIISANPEVNPNKLKPGTVLNIPALAKRDAKSDTAEAPAVASSTGAPAVAKVDPAKIDPTKQYVVKPGDSLHKIASTLWNDSSLSTKLYDLNKSVIGADPTKLKPGQVLTLPSPPTQKKSS